MASVVFDFAKLVGGKDKRQIGRIVAFFERYGCPVKAEGGVVVDDKTTRKSGMTTVGMTFYMADDQTVTLKVKQSGDIFEVQINGRAVPVTAQDATDQAIKEVCERLNKGRAAFVKKQAKQATPDLPEPKKGEAPATLATRVKQKQAVLVQKQEQIAELTAELAKK